MTLDIKATWLLQAMRCATTRVIINEGGTRSSKTISTCQYVALYALETTGETISIARKSFPALRISAMRDFFEVLSSWGLYDEAAHSKMTNTYMLNGNTIEFMSVDDPQKKRGSGRDVLWINEANELTEDDARQLALRTRKKILLDYNPSESPEHWIHQNYLSLPPDKVTVIRSTYLDNPFLPAEQIEEIERLKDQDPVAWSVFGLGKWAQLRGKIYTNWTHGTEFPNVKPVYGVDFGVSHATAVIKVAKVGDDLYWQEVLYETHLTTQDIIDRLKAGGVLRGSLLYCDSAEPDRIEELRRAGFDARPARKDVRAGIDFCRRHRIVLVDSPHTAKEIGAYKMRQNAQGMELDEPLKVNDHAMDAARYATYTHYFSPPSKVEYKATEKREAKFESGAW